MSRNGSHQKAAAGANGRSPSDPLPGQATVIRLRWRNRRAFPSVEPDRTEVVLQRRPQGVCFADIEGTTSAVEGFTDADATQLERLLTTGAERIAMVVDVDPQARKNQPTPTEPPWIAVNVYAYERGPLWATPLAVGVDDKSFRAIYRMAGMRGARQDPDRALEWLTRRLILPALPGSPPGAPSRLVISAGPHEINAPPAAFRIHGRGLTADVKTVQDRWLVSRVTRHAHHEQRGPLTLVHWNVQFTDVSSASSLREEMKRQLTKLASGEGFLAMWNEYNRLESRYLRRRVLNTGYVRYSDVEELQGGIHQFTVAEAPSPESGSSLLDLAQQMLAADEELELEGASDLPFMFFDKDYVDLSDAEQSESWGLLDDDPPEETIRGRVVRIDPDARTIDLRLAVEQEAPLRWQARRRRTGPPSAGFLYRSFRGDRRQLLRRRDAWNRVLQRGTPIYNLLPLLQGESVNAPAQPRIKPRSDAAWACFPGGEPTETQELALDVALNTPDIAIIQGPPGTGKTQLITALQTRLAEEGRLYTRLRGSMLLTSYQHAAVDELVERSVIFGLPANKVDRAGRGTTVQADRWRLEAISQLEQAVSTDHGRGLQVLRQVTALVAGYLLAPPSTSGVIRLLHEVEDLVTGLVPGRLREELRGRRFSLSAGRPQLRPITSDDYELAIRAIRGLRTTPDSFADDGPAAAAKALRRLRALPEADNSDLANALDLLDQAAAWPPADPPESLTDLARVRDELLDALVQPVGPVVDPVNDPDVTSVLARVSQALEEHVRSSKEDGAELALIDYLEGLHGDPAAVEWTLREYTASYAATCQQVSSPTMADAKQARIDEVIFDTVIVDEAARANPLDLMIPLIHAARRIVLVGDHNQLPHMLEPDVEKLFERQGQEPNGHLKESLFQRLFEGLGRPGAPVQRVVTLDTQFRMHPILGNFVSRNFYQGKLKSPRLAEEFAHNLPGYDDAVAAWISVAPERGLEIPGRSKLRPVEAVRVADEVARLLRAAPDLTVGVISFYAAQVKRIWQELASRHHLARPTEDGFAPEEELEYDSAGRRLDRLKVGTVDAFQGKQFDVVFLSVTRCGPPRVDQPEPTDAAYTPWVRQRYGHLTLRNRLCVAMSRQKRLLVAVGADAMFDPAPAEVTPLGDLLRLCRQEGGHGVFIPR